MEADNIKITTSRSIYRVVMDVTVDGDIYEAAYIINGAPSKEAAKHRAVFRTSFPDGNNVSITNVEKIK